MIIRLPLFITPRTRYLYVAALALISWTLYGITNHLPPQFPITTLSFTPLESALTLLPWAVWPYLTCFLVIILIALDVKNLENLQRLVYAFIIMQVLTNVIFIAFPVSLPRDPFPIPAGTYWVTNRLLEWARHVDTERNCFPSLHVADCFLITLVYWRENRFKLFLASPWLALVSFSTMATKQHYLWDVIGGIAMAILMFALFFGPRVRLVQPSK